ncbi:two-component system sensor histidine kinase CreC [Methylophilus sp. UBA6697]|uniref:two-component system sensor histidine kinase CreC n=1 Tax=Methylophilus sp. UBA6697 TaxID=1946902 RepID=UPI000ECEB87C|nr:two-component system sensor histidine kinase CreC [Methylophilus sp. UBA6697]HCU84587.1 two-component system sensor histidine kinase CreC [Methylophilus sp.]
MKISLKIFLGYFLLVGLAAWFVLAVFVDEVKPGVRQAMEDTLVDTANLLAELAKDDLKQGSIQNGQFARSLHDYQHKSGTANIWGVPKRSADYRVYITDSTGMVVFDSDHQAVGQDYSRWNDVYLTLKSRYGARTTPVDPTRPDGETVMYVAAPVMDNYQLIGVLTVAKPNSTMQPFILHAQAKIMRWGILLLALSLCLGILFTWRFTRAIHRLRDYAIAVAQGHKAVAPDSSNDELAELAQAMKTMRDELDGHQHIQEAIHQLTHELKSPMTAIQAATELITPEMPEQDRTHFLNSIKIQTKRLQHMIQNILGLAALEQQQVLVHPVHIALSDLVEQQLRLIQDRATQRNIQLLITLDTSLSIAGDAFLCGQAISNLLENALDFSANDSRIHIVLCKTDIGIQLSIQDEGSGIPLYALDKIKDKFYSLPRPANTPHAGQKSTGLGLNFVQQIMALHHGDVFITNVHPNGAIARLCWPG